MRAISAEAADIPVKPRMPAMIDTTKKISAHFKRVIARSSGLIRRWDLIEIARSLTSGDEAGSLAQAVGGD
jgi:hypothetical protein